MWYMVLVEKRQDLTIVDPFFHNTDVSWADIVWPADMNLRPRTAATAPTTSPGPSATMAAKAASASSTKSTNPDPSGNAGFRVVVVKEGLLYELVPQGREPYAK